MFVSGVLNDQKTRTFTQYLSNAVVQIFNDFLNKRERERERENDPANKKRFRNIWVWLYEGLVELNVVGRYAYVRHWAF